MKRLARLTKILGFTVLFVGVAITIAGLVRTYAAVQNPGLSLTDMATVKANGTSAVMLNVVVTAVVAGALLAVSRWAKGRGSRSEPSS